MPENSNAEDDPDAIQQDKLSPEIEAELVALGEFYDEETIANLRKEYLLGRAMRAVVRQAVAYSNSSGGDPIPASETNQTYSTNKFGILGDYWAGVFNGPIHQCPTYITLSTLDS